MRQWIAASLLALLPALPAAQPAARPATDLDRLMEEVVRRRDDNWKKLQQYILTERQRVSVTGPDGLRVYGSSHEYQWFVKEGFFIRSPLTANGVSLGEEDRRRYEQRYLARMKARDARKAKRDAEKGLPPPPEPAGPVGDLLSQQAEPAFVSAAYFLEFKFEPGRYALAGRERIDGREVLRIEYHPARLFDDEEETQLEVSPHGANVRREARNSERRRHRDDDRGDEVERQMNRTSLVTLWVLRDEKQIIRYVFDNVDWGFLPGRSVVRIDDVTASMKMHEAFPGVWLPQAIAARVQLVTALGPTGATYDVSYGDYRQAGVTVRVQ